MHFLINPLGLRYDEITEQNLVKIDIEGGSKPSTMMFWFTKACRIQMQVLASNEPYSEVPRDVQQTFIGQLADTSDPSTNSLPGTMNGQHSFESSTTPTPPIECEQ